MRRAQDRARSARSRKIGARSATIESRALGALKPARDENVPAKRADFFFNMSGSYFWVYLNGVLNLALKMIIFQQVSAHFSVIAKYEKL